MIKIDLEGKISQDLFLLTLQLVWRKGRDSLTNLLRKEVVHPHLPVRIPCYDLVLIANLAVEGLLL